MWISFTFQEWKEINVKLLQTPENDFTFKEVTKLSFLFAQRLHLFAANKRLLSVLGSVLLSDHLYQIRADGEVYF